MISQISILLFILDCRHLDEVFLTWNGSKKHLRTLFHLTANHADYCHHPSMRLRPCIEHTVRFDDAHLSHHQGKLCTKIYHYASVNLDGLFHIHHEPAYSDEQSLRKELIRIVRCCSDVSDFHDQQIRIQTAYPSYASWTKFAGHYIQGFLTEFSAPSWGFLVTTQEDYTTFRRRVLEHQQQQARLKKQREISETNTLIFLYKADVDPATVGRLEEKLNAVYVECCKHHSEWEQTRFKLVLGRPSPLSSNDYLADRRPPLRLLTLPKAGEQTLPLVFFTDTFLLRPLLKIGASSIVGNADSDMGDLNFIIKSMTSAWSMATDDNIRVFFWQPILFVYYSSRSYSADNQVEFVGAFSMTVRSCLLFFRAFFTIKKVPSARSIIFVVHCPSRLNTAARPTLSFHFDSSRRWIPTIDNNDNWLLSRTWSMFSTRSRQVSIVLVEHTTARVRIEETIVVTLSNRYSQGHCLCLVIVLKLCFALRADGLLF